MILVRNGSSHAEKLCTPSNGIFSGIYLFNCCQQVNVVSCKHRLKFEKDFIQTVLQPYFISLTANLESYLSLNEGMR